MCSPSTPEARGVHPAAMPGVGTRAGDIADLSLKDLVQVVAVTDNGSSSGLVAASYANGDVCVFRYVSRVLNTNIYL